MLMTICVQGESTLAKHTKVHFLTAYLEYLYDHGIRSDEYYLGDASRYLRFLLARTKAEDIDAFLETASSHTYRRRLAKTVRKFYQFASERLDLSLDPTIESRRN